MTQHAEPINTDDLAAATASERRRKADLYLGAMSEEALALCVDKTDLHYAFDLQGRHYIDLTSGGGVLPMGANQLVTSAIYASPQPYIAPFGATCQAPQVQFAQALSTLMPTVADEPQQVFFTNSGNDAMRVAQEMANWAGMTRANVTALDQRTYAPTDTGVAQKLCQMALDEDYPIICDERLTGFGRFGALRAAERYDLDVYAPNMITVFGESAGGGVPIGMVVAPRKYFPPGAPWLAPAPGGNPMACAAGFQILVLQGEFFYEHVREASEELERLTEGLCAQFPTMALRHQGRGMARAILLHPGIDTSLLTRSLLNNGVIAAVAADYLLLLPPLTMTEFSLGEAFNQLAAAMVDLEAVMASN